MSKADKSAAPPIFAMGGSKPAPFAAGADDLRLRMTLRQVGFDPAAPPPRKAAPPVVAKTPVANGAAAPDERLALRRREWLADTMERQRALSPIASGLLTAQGLTREQFLHDFYAPGRPVVIKGAMADWPALGLWTPDYLTAAVGDAAIEYQGGRRANARFEMDKDRHRAVMPFSRFMAMIAAGGENDAYITAYNSAANTAAFAPLHRDMGYLDAWLTRAHGMLWMGPQGTFTPLHFDLTNNLLAQVTGTKRIVLIPPSQTRHLAHRTHVFSDVGDITDPARLALYPAARDVLRYEVELAPGDLLFIPIGWWHQVRSESFSVMATYTNFLWPNAGHENYPAG